MATGDAGGILFTGGTLIASPTNIVTGASPAWGGTVLGLVKNVVAKTGRKVSIIREESLGPAPFNGVDLGEAWSLVGSFRGYDQDAVRKVFASTATGTATSNYQIQYPNGFKAGGLLSNLGFPLMLQPDDYERGRWLYLYNAIPITTEEGELPFQRGEEWIIPFKFIAIPDGSGRVMAYGLREDLNSIL